MSTARAFRSEDVQKLVAEIKDNCAKKGAHFSEEDIRKELKSFLELGASTVQSTTTLSMNDQSLNKQILAYKRTMILDLGTVLILIKQLFAQQQAHLNDLHTLLEKTIDLNVETAEEEYKKICREEKESQFSTEIDKKIALCEENIESFSAEIMKIQNKELQAAHTSFLKLFTEALNSDKRTNEMSKTIADRITTASENCNLKIQEKMIIPATPEKILRSLSPPEKNTGLDEPIIPTPPRTPNTTPKSKGQPGSERKVPIIPTPPRTPNTTPKSKGQPGSKGKLPTSARRLFSEETSRSSTAAILVSTGAPPRSTSSLLSDISHSDEIDNTHYKPKPYRRRSSTPVTEENKEENKQNKKRSCRIL